jgi:Fe-S cluster assembly protein SufD
MEWKEKYRRLYELAFAKLPADWLSSVRQFAIERLNQLEFPTRRQEDWKYTSFSRPLGMDFVLPQAAGSASQSFGKSNFDIPGAIRLTFVNGVFQPEASELSDLPKGLEIEVLGDPVQSDRGQSDWQQVAIQSLAQATNALVALNFAFAHAGVIIRVAKNLVLDRPVHLYHLGADTANPVFQNPQIFLFAEAGAQILVIEEYTDAANALPVWTNCINRFFVGPNAQVSHCKIQNLSIGSFQYHNTEVSQERDSTFNAWSIDTGSSITRNNLSVALRGENTTTHLYGATLISSGQHVDNQTFVDHAVPNCFSNELYKNVVGGNGRGVFNGKVLVRQDAQKTNAYQQNANLLTSEQASMDTKPQLEIFADDVKCSHGATIGQLDESAIFYLRSRGLPDAIARGMLQHAFLEEVVQRIDFAPLRDKVENLLLSKFTQNLTH